MGTHALPKLPGCISVKLPSLVVVPSEVVLVCSTDCSARELIELARRQSEGRILDFRGDGF